ncbi:MULTISPECIES: ComEC/Rec2 family competence protein [unclassified Arthrobacter]|uniref:ComEC/Rec2 family competence protein n=1 Tax=unclassified Arthrobacter TaxID=235627 RepID=UPI00159E0C87|nr:MULTISPECIES: ComEC/Rec2 family competence protein [unclassified Arthrobacter]MCQ9164403.1 ComEC/Rec2 family competence protein [Arthrobacter sp. STN4]NVM97947.1 ComEC/Rec2 family competence protein [Arthrobacter sp. SDTb3-6]
MRRPDARWRHYARAAVDGPRSASPARADGAMVDDAASAQAPASASGRSRACSRAGRGGAASMAAIRVRLQTRLHALATERGTATDPGLRPRPDVRLLPAVAATWAGAAVAIGQPWGSSAVAAACCPVLCAAAAAVALRGLPANPGPAPGPDSVKDGGPGRDGSGRPARDGSGRPGRDEAVRGGLPSRGEAARTDARGPSRTRTRGSVLPGVAATVAVAALCLGVVLLAVALRQQDRQNTPLAAAVASGWQLSLTLEVMESPRPLAAGPGPPQVTFAAVVRQATAHGRRLDGPLPIRVVAGMDWLDVPEGATVGTAGTVPPAGLAERDAGILHPSTAPLEVRTQQAGSPALAFRSGWLRAARRVWAGTAPDVAGLLPGMVMGDRSASPPGLAGAMKAVGLTHLTAVSGANCTLVLSALMAGLRSLHAPRWAAGAAAVLGLAGFVAVVGPDPSVLRAAVMGGIGCAAMLSGRPRRVGALLSASIVVLLVADPWLARDFAFILSVLATLGLHLMGRRCARWLGTWLPAWAAQAVAIPLAAQLFCAPAIVLLQPRLAIYTVPANMAAAPVVALVTTVGTLGLVAAPLVPLAADLCAWVSGWGAWWVAAVARWMAALPAAGLPWPGGVRGVVLMALMDAAVLGALAALVERQQLAGRLAALRAGLPEQWRFLLGFSTLSVSAAVAAGLWTMAVLGA